jgi:carbonic anhydrase
MKQITSRILKRINTRSRANAVLLGLIPALSCAVLTASAQDSQSPIDIVSSSTVYDPSLPALGFSYGLADLSVINNGSPEVESTIRANVAPGHSLEVSGVTYNLAQFHFHTESEHLVNGVESAMEMHLVHQDASGNYLVIGRLIEPGAENTALDPIFANLPPDSSSPALDVDNFDLDLLLPDVLTSFRYSGSLTTSPYTEPVQWIMLSETLELSQEQIDNFRALFDVPEGNHREAQPLNGRVIATDVAGFSSVPDGGGISLMLVSLGMLAGTRRLYRKG